MEEMRPVNAALNDGSGAMFDRIAPRYDVLNRLMSFGLDGRWRRRLVQALALNGVEPGGRVLDVATGTGDVALAILAAHPCVNVVGLDPSQNMLNLAGQKARARAVRDRAFVQVLGDAQALQFDDDAFAAACISFGIRNVPQRLDALTEMARVVRPGGVVAVLELGEPQDGPLRLLAKLHVHVIVPLIGTLFSGAGAYQYLQKSIEQFPPPTIFLQTMREAGLCSVTVTRLSFGAVNLYVGLVPST